mmetsp:Transcript_15010/g.14587  ORF Transcript_15010/g.14587 Transcript_15010/m.14587 type:complete len:84 (+) Transcript_15010:643-894(+)
MLRAINKVNIEFESGSGSGSGNQQYLNPNFNLGHSNGGYLPNPSRFDEQNSMNKAHLIDIDSIDSIGNNNEYQTAIFYPPGMN